MEYGRPSWPQPTYDSRIAGDTWRGSTLLGFPSQAARYTPARLLKNSPLIHMSMKYCVRYADSCGNTVWELWESFLCRQHWPDWVPAFWVLPVNVYSTLQCSPNLLGLWHATLFRFDLFLPAGLCRRRRVSRDAPSWL